MSRTFVRQDTQIRNSDAYDDTIAPTEAAYETNPTNIETDLNNIRSQMQNIMHRDGASFPTGDWFSDLVAPSTFENGAARGVDTLNQDLHDFQRKRVLVKAISLADVTVSASENWVILGSGELPPNTTAAVGAVTTLGTVVATHGGTFGTHDLTEVAGSNAIAPKNFVVVADGATRDPILSSGRQIYGLLHGESGVTDGATITDTTTTRVQVSFVRINATGDDLEAVPVADIENQTVNFVFTERKAIEDLTEQDFLRGAVVDVPAASTVTRQVAYDNQGTTPVDLTTAATLDLEGAGIAWTVRDDLEADLFSIVEGSAGGTSQVNVHSDVDEFDVDAAVNDFAEGVTVDSSGTAINVGVTAAQIDAAASLTITSTGGASDLNLFAGNELYFDDTNQTGSTWTQNGIKLSETTTEWDDFETAFGEVSLLNAIVQANNNAGRTKGVAVVTGGNQSAGTNITGVGGGSNLDATLPDYSSVTFLTDVDVYVNGVLMRNDASTTGANDHDVYPGDTPANGDLKFEFQLKGNGSNADVITMIVYGA